jgi:prolyl oligopeptidase PreP (S9A serine peptidase family)
MERIILKKYVENCKQGSRRPRNTWRRTVLEEAKRVKKTWTEIKTDAKNRVR